jgi:hypothetical protein
MSEVYYSTMMNPTTTTKAKYCTLSNRNSTNYYSPRIAVLLPIAIFCGSSSILPMRGRIESGHYELLSLWFHSAPPTKNIATRTILSVWIYRCCRLDVRIVTHHSSRMIIHSTLSMDTELLWATPILRSNTAVMARPILHFLGNQKVPMMQHSWAFGVSAVLTTKNGG